MPRGYPDFFGFSVFPFWGSPLLATFADAAIGAGVRVPMHALNLKGQIAGGFLRITNTADFNNTYLHIVVDGVRVFYLNLHTLFYRLQNPNSWPLVFTCVYMPEQEYYLGYIKGFPFGNTFQIDITGPPGGCRAYSELTYFHVT